MAAVTFNAGDVLTAAQMNQIGKDSDWITISSFSNSWVAGSVTPAYRKVGNRVQLRGRITNGTGTSTTAFTLPAGYRPTTVQTQPTATASSFNYVQIDTSGNVAPTTSGSPVSLDALSFYID